MAKGNRKRVATIHWRDPHCHWCGQPTEMVPRANAGSFRLRGNTATLDHVYSRMTPQRGEPGNARLVVLACYSCNHLRATVESKLSSLHPSAQKYAARVMGDIARFIRDPFGHLRPQAEL